jgi:transporter family protein
MSGAFAALTAIFGKVGVAGINPDLATLVRTVVILATLAAIVAATGQWQAPETISFRTWLFLILSGLATGASWPCYFRALKLGDAGRVVPIDKLSGLNWLGVALIAVGALLVAIKVGA